MRADFTLGGRIPVLDWYLNDMTTTPIRWTKSRIGKLRKKVHRNPKNYYGATDGFLMQALREFPVRGKNVAIMGSESPWYECVCLEYGARVTTVEYRHIDCELSELEILTPESLESANRKFDCILSISSIEHDGLGRYGDELNASADIGAMTKFSEMLTPEGVLILSVPVGPDAVVWNAHRIYGPLRLPMLLSGWDELASFGYSPRLLKGRLAEWHKQPVWVLRPKRELAKESTL
jgi:hypothetical protein